jgi:hypothetical protein
MDDGQMQGEARAEGNWEMKYLKFKTTIVIIIITSSLLLVCEQNRRKEGIGEDMEAKAIEIIKKEEVDACCMFKKEEDISKAKSFLMETIGRIMKMRNKHIDMIDACKFSNIILVRCYFRLAYLHKCQEDESACRMIYNRLLDGNLLPSENQLLEQTRWGFFEENVLLMSLGRQTIWNAIDRRLQNEACAFSTRKGSELFAKKLGITISLNGNWEDFHSDLEEAITKEGLGNILARARNTDKWSSGGYFFTTKENPSCAMIEYSDLLKDAAITYSLSLKKNSEGEFISCSFSIRPLNGNRPQANHKHGVPSRMKNNLSGAFDKICAMGQLLGCNRHMDLCRRVPAGTSPQRPFRGHGCETETQGFVMRPRRAHGTLGMAKLAYVKHFNDWTFLRDRLKMKDLFKGPF